MLYWVCSDLRTFGVRPVGQTARVRFTRGDKVTDLILLALALAFLAGLILGLRLGNRT